MTNYARNHVQVEAKTAKLALMLEVLRLGSMNVAEFRDTFQLGRSATRDYIVDLLNAKLITCRPAEITVASVLQFAGTDGRVAAFIEARKIIAHVPPPKAGRGPRLPFRIPAIDPLEAHFFGRVPA